MDFLEYLRKSDISENSKVYYGLFLRNGLHERYCYISKNRWDVQYLEKSASHWLLVERWRWNWMTEVFAAVCPWISIRLLRPSFIKGNVSSPCHNFFYLFFQNIQIIHVIWTVNYVLILKILNPHPF